MIHDMCTRIPSWPNLMVPVLEALKHYNGIASSKDIDEYVKTSLRLHEIDQKVFKKQISFSRTYLKIYGLANYIKPGLWFIEKAYASSNSETLCQFIKKRKKIYGIARGMIFQLNGLCKTFNDSLSRKEFTIEDKVYYIEYSRHSLAICSHNLDLDDYNQLCKNLKGKYVYDKEKEKERRERFVLDYYIHNMKPEYSDFQISKKIRPDFILDGHNERIGIEITEPLTMDEAIGQSIVQTDYIPGMSANDLQKTAWNHHGDKAKHFNITNIVDSIAVGSGLVQIDYAKMTYADGIVNKLRKYQKTMETFDRFLVLANLWAPLLDQINELDEIWEYVCQQIKLEKLSIHNCEVIIMLDNERNGIPGKVFSSSK